MKGRVGVQTEKGEGLFWLLENKKVLKELIHYCFVFIFLKDRKMIVGQQIPGLLILIPLVQKGGTPGSQSSHAFTY